jgi:hypothetical protein
MKWKMENSPAPPLSRSPALPLPRSSDSRCLRGRYGCHMITRSGPFEGPTHKSFILGSLCSAPGAIFIIQTISIFAVAAEGRWSTRVAKPPWNRSVARVVAHASCEERTSASNAAITSISRRRRRWSEPAITALYRGAADGFFAGTADLTATARSCRRSQHRLRHNRA